jgi:FkbM family methyltransferase
MPLSNVKPLVGALLATWLALCVSACSEPEAVPIAQFIAQEKALYARDNEELLIRHFFKDRREGIYIDVGCFDYKDYSTTYYLEEHLGWRGIGIDAEEMHRDGWEKHRTESKFFAYAVSDKSGETITFHRAGALSATDDDYENLKFWKERRKFETRSVDVETITLDDLLKREGLSKVDFLSLDINGAEPIALAGFDIKRFKPDLVHVEASPHRQEELRKYFDENGYRLIEEYAAYDATNWYLTPR